MHEPLHFRFLLAPLLKPLFAEVMIVLVMLNVCETCSFDGMVQLSRLVRIPLPWTVVYSIHNTTKYMLLFLPVHDCLLTLFTYMAGSNGDISKGAIGGGTEIDTGAWVCPYWMARYYGIITAPPQ